MNVAIIYDSDAYEGMSPILRAAELYENHDAVDGIVIVCPAGQTFPDDVQGMSSPDDVQEALSTNDVQEMLSSDDAQEPVSADSMQEVLHKNGMQKILRVVPGGETPQVSIFAGLEAAREIAAENEVYTTSMIVLLHDAAKPLVGSDLITACLENTRDLGSAVVASPLADTIIQTDIFGLAIGSIDRDQCMVAQTPQCFHLQEIWDVCTQAKEEDRRGFADAAAIMLSCRHDISIVSAV